MIDTSQYFKNMVRALVETMQFKHNKGLAVFMWVVLPVVPFTVLGWYLADMLSKDS